MDSDPSIFHKILTAKEGLTSSRLPTFLSTFFTQEIQEDDSVLFVGDPPVQLAKEFQVLDCADPQNRLGVIRGFLSAKDIGSMKAILAEPGIEVTKTGGKNLKYSQIAYRFERQLRFLKPGLFSRLVDTAWAIDRKLWRKIHEDYVLYPEVEYIEYDVGKSGKVGKIAPHVDSDSLVSLVVMLSEPHEFAGGINMFDDGTQQGRQVVLKQGDAIFFNGEDCEHWITPVTGGRRAVLQLELSAGHQTMDGLVLGWICAMVVTISAAFHIYAIAIHPAFWSVVVLVLLFVTYFFGGDKRRLPIGLRHSPVKLTALLLSMFLGYGLLASSPSLLAAYYDGDSFSSILY